MKVELIRSQTWCLADFETISAILDETIKKFVTDNDKIINIEAKEINGNSQFWIYIIKDYKTKEE